jgi:hypothetical protein
LKPTPVPFDFISFIHGSLKKKEGEKYKHSLSLSLSLSLSHSAMLFDKISRKGGKKASPGVGGFQEMQNPR